MFASLVIALVAVGVAIGAWFRPTPDNKPAPPPSPTSFTDQQVAEAKAKVCGAHEKAHNANTVSAARDRGTDPTGQLAFKLNARQALLAGSLYLQTTLSEEPATPPDLAAAVRKLANVFQELTVDFVIGVNDSETAPLLRTADETTSTIERLCK